MELTKEQARDYMKKTLTNKGLYVEEGSDGSLSISLTQFSLSCVYATVDNDEIDYFIDNLDDEEKDDIIKELEA